MAKMSAIFTNRRSFNGKVIWLYVVSVLESLRNKDQNIWSSCLILFLSSLNLTMQFPSPVKYLKALCFHTCRSESVFVMEYPNGLNPKSTIVRFISYVDDLLIQSLLVMCDSVMKSIYSRTSIIRTPLCHLHYKSVQISESHSVIYKVAINYSNRTHTILIEHTLEVKIL